MGTLNWPEGGLGSVIVSDDFSLAARFTMDLRDHSGG